VTALDVESPRIPLPFRQGQDLCSLVGEDPAMRDVFRLVTLAAPTRASVMIVGEPGTGREAVARCIHASGPLANGPWIVVHCAAMSERELEGELFGEEFETADGRVSRRIGRLEESRGGTLYLDEVSALTLATQSRLLHATTGSRIESRRSTDVPGEEIRLIASAAHDLRPAVAAHGFRGDLFFQLTVVTIRLPLLRERGNDLLLLAAHFVRALPGRPAAAKPLTGISALALRALQARQWQGNVAELRDLVGQVLRTAPDETIRLADLPPEVQEEAKALVHEAATDLPTLAEMEARHIELVLQRTDGSIHRAADILGVHRNTLSRKIRQYGIEHDGSSTYSAPHAIPLAR